MNRTTASGNVSSLYVDEDVGASVQGTALVAADRNAIQEELINAIEGAGLTPSSSNDAQLLAALRAGHGSSFNADKLDGAEKDTDGTLSGNSDNSMPTERAVRTYVAAQIAAAKNADWPVGSSYIQLPGGLTPGARGLPGTWTAQFETEGIFLRSPGGYASAFNGGVQADMFQAFGFLAVASAGAENCASIGYRDSGFGARNGSDTSGGANYRTTNGGSKALIGSDGTNGTPRKGPETRPSNRTARFWIRTE